MTLPTLNPAAALQNIWVRYILILFVGITVGAIFYPTRRVEEKTSAKYEQQISQMKTEFSQYKSLSEEKITSLTSQVTDLSSHSKVVYEKITRPDGTIEVHQTTVKNTTENTDSSSSTTDEKTVQMQKDFASKEQQYQQTIQTLEKSKTVTVNEKHFGVEIGIMNDKDYYVHGTADLWGPVFLGIQGEVKGPSSDQNADNRVGVGIGLRF